MKKENDLFIELCVTAFRSRLENLEESIQKDFAISFYEDALLEFFDLIKECYKIGDKYEKKKNVFECQSEELPKRCRCKKTELRNVSDARRN